jgi:thiamine-phosphate pyrophosphorylase
VTGRAGERAGRVGRPGRLLVLTDRHQCRRPLPETVRAAVDGGARTVVLREKDLPADRRARLAAVLADLLRPVAGTLIVAGPEPPGPEIPGRERDLHTGVHLAADDPVPDPKSRLTVGRSCHDPREVVAAAAEGADYLTVSPVFLTPSKPGYGPALGLAGLRRLVALTDVPVYALGGVDALGAAACLEAGAAGIAVMGAVMRAEDPAEVVRRLVEEVGG